MKDIQRLFGVTGLPRPDASVSKGAGRDHSNERLVLNNKDFFWKGVAHF